MANFSYESYLKNWKALVEQLKYYKTLEDTVDFLPAILLFLLTIKNDYKKYKNSSEPTEEELWEVLSALVKQYPLYHFLLKIEKYQIDEYKKYCLNTTDIKNKVSKCGVSSVVSLYEKAPQIFIGEITQDVALILNLLMRLSATRTKRLPPLIEPLSPLPKPITKETYAKYTMALDQYYAEAFDRVPPQGYCLDDCFPANDFLSIFWDINISLLRSSLISSPLKPIEESHTVDNTSPRGLPDREDKQTAKSGRQRDKSSPTSFEEESDHDINHESGGSSSSAVTPFEQAVTFFGRFVQRLDLSQDKQQSKSDRTSGRREKLIEENNIVQRPHRNSAYGRLENPRGRQGSAAFLGKPTPKQRLIDDGEASGSAPEPAAPIREMINSKRAGMGK